MSDDIKHKLLSNAILTKLANTEIGHCARVDYLDRSEAIGVCQRIDEQQLEVTV